MAVLTVTISDPSPAFQKKSSEVAYLQQVLHLMAMELAVGRGTKTSGTIIGTSAAGTPNTSLGSWTYTPAASNP
jgi:hypothetical protein